MIDEHLCDKKDERQNISKYDKRNDMIVILTICYGS